MAGPKFKALFGDPRQARIMEMAFDPSELDALRGFGDVMDAIGRVTNVGSDTAGIRKPSGRQGSGPPLVARIMRNMNPAQLLKRASTRWQRNGRAIKKMDAGSIYPGRDAAVCASCVRWRQARNAFATGVAQLLASLGEAPLIQCSRGGGVEPPSDSSARPQSAPAAALPKRSMETC